MRLSTISLFLISLAFIAACQMDSAAPVNVSAVNTKPAVDVHGHEDDARRIFLADAKKLFDGGKAYFIDNRGEGSYKEEHIKGAVNITKEQLEAKFKQIPRNKTIIVYCS